MKDLSKTISCRCSYPLLLLFCICKQLPDVRLRLSYIFVENLWAVDDLWLSGSQHFADLPSHQGFAAAWWSVQQDSLDVFTACKDTYRRLTFKNVKLKSTRHIKHIATCPGAKFAILASDNMNLLPNRKYKEFCEIWISLKVII